MPPGHRPPIIPPRNLLNRKTPGIGKAPLVKSYGVWMQSVREKARRKALMKSKIAVPVINGTRMIVPLSPRDAARATLGIVTPERKRAEGRVAGQVEKAQQRMEADIRQATERGEADARKEQAKARADATFRPPRTAAGRYSGLKDGQPG